MTNSTTGQNQETQTTPQQQQTSMSGWLDDHLASMQDLQDEYDQSEEGDAMLQWAQRILQRPVPQ